MNSDIYKTHIFATKLNQIAVDIAGPSNLNLKNKGNRISHRLNFITNADVSLSGETKLHITGPLNSNRWTEWKNGAYLPSMRKFLQISYLFADLYKYILGEIAGSRGKELQILENFVDISCSRFSALKEPFNTPGEHIVRQTNLKRNFLLSVYSVENILHEFLRLLILDEMLEEQRYFLNQEYTKKIDLMKHEGLHVRKIIEKPSNIEEITVQDYDAFKRFKNSIEMTWFPPDSRTSFRFNPETVLERKLNE